MTSWSVVLRDWLGEAKAKQVYLILRDRILSGALGFGTKLPTENELADYYAVSRVTVRRALGELERERFIERRRSAGTRVIKMYWMSSNSSIKTSNPAGPYRT